MDYTNETTKFIKTNEYFQGGSMNTYIYMVRHGESPKLDGGERTRGLTEKGSLDVHKVTDILKTEGIDTFISSPYKRAVLTIENS